MILFHYFSYNKKCNLQILLVFRKLTLTIAFVIFWIKIYVSLNLGEKRTVRKKN